MDIDWKRIYAELHLVEERGLLKQSRLPRQEMLEEARKWPRGDLPDYCSEVPSIKSGVMEQVHTVIYQSNELEIGIFAPGKEASNKSTTKAYVGDRGPKPNHNDMLPIITVDGNRIDDIDLTFGQMFDILGKCAKKSEEGLLILSAMFYRNGFCLDHIINNGTVRLHIPSYSLLVLKKEISHIGEIPVEAFIYFMDVLAMNEDAKVHALGRVKFERYGRTNTLLTFTHVIAVLIGRVSLAKLCGSFSRPPSGMAPITDKDARGEIFRLLKEKSMK